MAYARDIHAEWRNYFETGEILPVVDPRPLVEIMGDPEWHQRWIDTYNEVIDALNGKPVE